MNFALHVVFLTKMATVCITTILPNILFLSSMYPENKKNDPEESGIRFQKVTNGE